MSWWDTHAGLEEEGTPDPALSRLPEWPSEVLCECPETITSDLAI